MEYQLLLVIDAKFCLHIYIKYMICKHFVDNIFK